MVHIIIEKNAIQMFEVKFVKKSYNFGVKPKIFGSVD